MAKKSSETSSPSNDSGGVVISSCKCSHVYQDEKYGKGKRVFNKNLREKTKNEGVCTVCGTRKTL